MRSVTLSTHLDDLVVVYTHTGIISYHKFFAGLFCDFGVKWHSSKKGRKAKIQSTIFAIAQALSLSLSRAIFMLSPPRVLYVHLIHSYR